ncbi:MAG: methyltransferase regulatory domain-containing protein [Pseudomonadales bacterium]|nr:methyltransferase regulatory domain-containing protein [Pseudomonadales bacterium]
MNTSEDWTSGYVADIGYTYGYYHELNPMRARLGLLYNGIVCPEFNTACELGFGQGLSVNMHAAASSNSWFGTDFNPAQAGFAQELSAASGASAGLSDEAFREFCNRDDLPEFDFIGLHGIWSWINKENQDVIVDFVRRKLRVGGVLYISYNAYPGWAAFAPMRQLMSQHAEIIGSEGRGLVSGIDGAIKFADELLKTNPIFLRANPLVNERVKKMQDMSRHYLAHEYFNRDWHPEYFSKMADSLSSAKLDFACSAHFLNFIDSINLSKEQQEFLNQIPDRMLRESTRDFMINTQFRKDYWVKGLRRLSSDEQAELFLQERIVLRTPRDEVALKVKTPLGEADMAEAVYNPILDVLSDNEAHVIGEIAVALKETGISLAQISQAIMLLTSAGYVFPAQSEKQQKSVSRQCKALNDHLVSKARYNNDVETLASPVTGGGIPVSRFSQIYLNAYRKGIKSSSELAEVAWKYLKSQNQKLLKDGQVIEKDEDNIAELEARAIEFLEKQIKVLKGLKIM